MRVFILTSSLRGTASYFLQQLLERQDITWCGVIYCRGLVRDKTAFRKRKWQKIRRIGILGALNGIRMRPWFREEVADKLSIENLEQVCDVAGIPFLQTDYLNSAETRELIRGMQADLGLSLGNSFIAPSVFGIPRYGMINFHAEMLPAFQNAQSVIWQIHAGSRNSGYTFHKVSRQIDGGDILFQEVVPIQFGRRLHDTVVETNCLILQRAARGLGTLLSQFDEYWKKAIPQGPGTHYTTPSFLQFVRILSRHRKLKQN